MTNQNVAIAERFTKAVYAGDQAGLRSLLDPDFVLRQDKALPYGGVYKGADGFLAFLAKLSATFEIQSLEKTRTFVTDDPSVLVFEFAFRGTVKEARQPFDTTVLEQWRFKNAKIISIVPHWFELPGRR